MYLNISLCIVGPRFGILKFVPIILYDIYYKVFAADQLFIDISTISISTDHIVLILKYTPSFRASKTTAVMFALAYVAGQHFW